MPVHFPTSDIDDFHNEVETELYDLSRVKPIVSRRNGTLYTSSHHIARFFRRKHETVVRRLLELEHFNFFKEVVERTATTFTEAGNPRKTTVYDIPHSGFDYLSCLLLDTKDREKFIEYIKEFEFQQEVMDFHSILIAHNIEPDQALEMLLP